MDRCPVEIVVIEMADDERCGTVLQEFVAAHESAAVRLLDVLLVSVTEEGLSFSTPVSLAYEDIEFGTALSELLELEAAELSVRDLQNENEQDAHEYWTGHAVQSTWQALESLTTGSTAVIAIVQHTWIGDLQTAVKALSGTVLLRGTLGSKPAVGWSDHADAALLLRDCFGSHRGYPEFSIRVDAALAEQIDDVFERAAHDRTTSSGSVAPDC
ncbi:MAG: hypothetical protein EG823_04115 [Actinobacteria bacterium]|nr:hypothetical protein [Actinomycetota bacterium]